MDFLKKYLDKIGVKEFSQLTEDEKETYRNWEEALVGRKLTDDDVATFLVKTENDIIEKLVLLSGYDEKDAQLKAELNIIRKIKDFLKTPELERKMMENNLANLLKK
jgi:hypothetical protein